MSQKALKMLVVALSAVIVALLAILIFVKPAQEQAGSPNSGGSATTDAAPLPVGAVVVSPDGHLSVPTLHVNDVVGDPVSLNGTITGGGWFFEGSFPIQLFNSAGLLMGMAQAHAQGDWTSTGTVAFTVNIPYAPTTDAAGTLVFQKDNPSGTTQGGMSFSVPIRFK